MKGPPFHKFATSMIKYSIVSSANAMELSANTNEIDLQSKKTLERYLLVIKKTTTLFYTKH